MIVLLYFFLLIATSLADVSISKPNTGSTFTASGGTVSIPIEWTDDGTTGYSLSDVQSYTILLCSGPNSDIDCFATLTKSLSATESYTATVDSSLYPDGYYYIQISALYDSGYTLHYSNRFELSGMSGSSDSITATATGTAPGPQTSVTTNVETTTADVSASFTVPYTLQTGKTRYAPMQMQPGSSVTHTMWSRRFPTSAVTYYTSASKSPNVLSTITPGWSYTMSSLINYATPAPYPTYWYPASQRVVAASLASDAKRKKRWEE